jgi:4-amino-4-deoxy-L-arabinose transferase-like glycosyltransferase
MEERDARFLRLLFLIALLIRLAFVWQIRDLPTQRWLVMDAQRYDELARQIAGGSWMPREAFYQAPLYPYVLAAVYTVTQSSMLAVRLLQAILGAATVVLLALLARRLFGREAGVVTGGLAALYGPAIFYVPLLLKSTLTLLALAGAVLLLVPVGSPSRRRLLGAGALFGVSALLQENLLLLVPCGALWLLLGDRTDEHGRARTDTDSGGASEGPWPQRLLPAATLLLGALLGLAPATLLNLFAGGEVVLTSSQGGMNFFIGNARGASGTYGGLSGGSQNPESQREDARRMAAAFASRERGRPVAPEELSPGEVSALFWCESFREIRANPAAWGRLLLRKVRLFWNAHEIPDAEGYDVYREAAGGPTFFWLGFGLVAPLGLTGLWLAGRDPQTRRGANLLALLLLGLCVSVVLFFVFGRYRLPVVVLLLPAAGHALAVLAEAVRRRQWSRDLAMALPVALLAIVLVNLPAWSQAERQRLDSAIWFNLSTAALRGAQAAEEPQEAIALTSRAADDLARVLAVEPGFYVARVQRAAALHRRGLYLMSTGAVEAGLASSEEARRELATASASGGGREVPEAARQARQLAAALDASLAQGLVNLGARRIEAGDLAQAETALRRAVALAPRSAPAHGNLGLCLLRQGLRAREAGDAPTADRLLVASRDAFAQALTLVDPQSHPGEAAFYQKGLEMAER